MNIRYRNKSVQEYCEDYRVALRRFGNPQVVRKLAALLYDLRYFNKITDFATVPKLKKYNLHDLVGDKNGYKSLKIDYSYRMEVVVELYADDNASGVDEIVIMEVSKHYGN